MNHEEAMQHGLGYASGREDASGTPTAIPPAEQWSSSGWYQFAGAYARGWDDFGAGRRTSMTNCRDAYDRWQESGGRSIFPRGDLTLSDDARAELRTLWPDPWSDKPGAYAAYYARRDEFQDAAWAAVTEDAS